MDRATARALSAINRRFYSERAAEFSATRKGPWAGWARLAEVLQAHGLPAEAGVLDVGCGNARLGCYLARTWPALRYTGLDASEAMLAIAQQADGLGPAPDLVRVDLVEDDLAAALGDRHFDLAACIGLLHHLPGRARRRALLETLLARLAPGGLLAVTCWRLARFERFRSRIVAWERWNETAEEPIDPTLLEPGDHLLPFGPDPVPRYVHFAGEDETAELLAELPCQILETWTADGEGDGQNRYFVVRPRPD